MKFLVFFEKVVYVKEFYNISREVHEELLYSILLCEVELLLVQSKTRYYITLISIVLLSDLCFQNCHMLICK